MDPTVAGRALMGDSLGFHIIFALLGVGIPFLLLIGELWAIKTKNQRLRDAVKKWSFVAVILVVAGIISGTIIAFQFALLWPNFTKFMSPVMGHAMMIEGYAFLIEAIFLAFYVFTWDRLSPIKHWLLTFPIFLGATGSAFFITTVNAWMNSPQGFRVQDGKAVDIDRWAAMFNPATFYETSHSIIAYYLATTLVFAGAYAWMLFKKRGSAADRTFYSYIVTRLSAIALVLVVVVAFIGHLSGQYLAAYEPRKLAALELHMQTSSQAPIVFGGSYDEATGQVKNGIQIPYLLSILAGNNPNTTVAGLNEFPKNEWPPLVVHLLFDIKMMLVGLLATIPAGVLFFAWWAKRKARELPRWFLPAVVAAGPAAIVVIELGWMLTELGRQPFVIAGYMRTSEAFTTSHSAVQIGYLFPLLYIGLFIATAFALRVLVRQQKGAKTL